MSFIRLLFLSFFIYFLYSPFSLADQQCQQCHQQQFNDWLGSDHQLSMQHASETSILGDFDQATFTYNGITSTFYKKGPDFFVKTDGSDGKLQDFKISYTFGHFPLQQYMVEFANGHVQVLDIAWDSRSKESGGQRWYHLHPDNNVKAGDELHWTSINMNWNFMCADCHSTNVKKNYNPVSKTYNTTFDKINVGCDACHGDTGAHLNWAKSDQQGDNKILNKLTPPNFDHSTRQGTIEKAQFDTCIRCHSRRTQLNDHYQPGDNFDNHYLNATLRSSLYFSDGQIKDEVFVYNSFTQSKMFESGVTCNNCHDSHSMKLKLSPEQPREQICYQCHQASSYQTEQHHKHTVGDSGSDCISCHMPSRIYMGVDKRFDHSFRVPRPDLSVSTDIPNACTQCHQDKDANWATRILPTWYGKRPIGHQNFSDTLSALAMNAKGAYQNVLSMVIEDTPSIAKATAAEYLGNYPSRDSFNRVVDLLKNKHNDIRLSALKALEQFPLQVRLELTLAMLDDKILPIRTEAARQLTALPAELIPSLWREKLAQETKAYKEVLMFNSERSESQLSLANMALNQADFKQAEQHFKMAIELQPSFVPSYINYANFFQMQGNEASSLKVIQQGLALAPSNADLHYVLGMWQVRNGQRENGERSLAKAAQLAPNNARYLYVYAVSIGEQDLNKTFEILEQALEIETGNIEVIRALISYSELAADWTKHAFYQEYLNTMF